MEVLRKLCIATFVSLLFLVNYKTASLEIRGIGESCAENKTCSDAVIDAICSEGVCKCEFDIISDDKSRCLVRIGGPCQESEQCARGEEDGSSTCLVTSKICACTNEYTQSDDLKKCLKIINDLGGQPCEEDGQCRYGKPGELSSCRALTDETKKCGCNDNAVDGPSDPTTDPSVLNKCYLVSERVGDPCVVQTQCTVKLVYSQCKNESCVCSDNYVRSPDSSECLPKMDLGGSCKYSEQCRHIEHSTCSFKNTIDTTGLCECSAEYTSPSERNDLCLKEATRIDDSCSHQVQCETVRNSRCIQEKCVCTEDYVNNQLGTECLPKVLILNATCSENGQCQKQNSACETTTGSMKECKCSANQFVESWKTIGSCVEIVHERNKPCAEEVQCIAGLGPLSTCADGVCQCKLSYGYHNGKCYIPAKLNELCEVVEQCYVGVNNLTMCSTRPEDTPLRRCQCLPGTIPFQNNQKCFDPNKRVGSSCDSHEECTFSIVGTVYCETFTKSCACQLGSTPIASNSICTSGSGVSNIHQYFSFILTLLIIIVLETTF